MAPCARHGAHETEPAGLLRPPPGTRGGVDDPSLASRVGRAAAAAHVTVGGAESVTAGAVASVLATGEDASSWFGGALVSWSTEVKRSVLGVRDGPVVTAACALAMADGARRLLGCDVAYAVTGVGGPDPVEGQPAGTVWVAVCGLGPAYAAHHRIEGDPAQVVAGAVDAVLALLLERLSPTTD
jgi:nicotinamide-nucleotide amidase